jgi:kynurenine formamidase
VSLEKLMGSAVVLDVTHVKPGDGILPSDLASDQVGEGDIVLLCTGMGKHWGDEGYLTRYPYVTEETAQLLLDRGVKAVGVDWLSIEEYGRVGHPVHDLLLSRGVPIIECLANLDEIKGRRVSLICLPLKLKGVDGAPARVVAFQA